MFQRIALAYFFVGGLHVAAAAPALLYKPETGDIWLSGTQQTYGYSKLAALFLNSPAGRLVEAPTAPYPVAHPLDPTDSGFAWLHKELTLTLPLDYVDPLYLGSFVSPGTAANDLSARFVFSSFKPRVYFEQALPIQIVPEPPTARILWVGVSLLSMLCITRGRRSGHLRRATRSQPVMYSKSCKLHRDASARHLMGANSQVENSLSDTGHS